MKLFRIFGLLISLLCVMACGKEEVVEPIIEIQSKVYVVQSEGKTIEVVLKSNVAFKVEISDAWIKQVENPETRNLKEYHLFFDIAENVLSEDRKAKIFISDVAGKITSEIQITQRGFQKKTLMIDSEAFHRKLKKMCYGKKVESIEFIFNDKTTPTDSYQLLSTTASDYPIYAIFSDGVIEIFTEGDEIVLTSDCYEMFQGFCDIKTLDLSNIDTSNVTNMSGMFRDCTSLTSIDLSSFDTSNVESMWGMFDGCASLTSLDLSNFDTSNVRSMGYMFRGCTSLTSIDLYSFDTSLVTDMSGMFYSCASLTSLDLSNFDTSNVTSMSDMFRDCTSLTSIDLYSFDTSNVESMSGMFACCESLESVCFPNLNTPKLLSISYMFENCKSLVSLDLSGFDTSSVWGMNNMFCGCESLESLDLSRFNTDNVFDMYSMFAYCKSLVFLDISNFSFCEKTSCKEMFLETASESQDCTIIIPEAFYLWIQNQLTASYFTIKHP